VKRKDRLDVPVAEFYSVFSNVVHFTLLGGRISLIAEGRGEFGLMMKKPRMVARTSQVGRGDVAVAAGRTDLHGGDVPSRLRKSRCDEQWAMRWELGRPADSSIAEEQRLAIGVRALASDGNGSMRVAIGSVCSVVFGSETH
jgi:hypothetical protein